MFLYLSSSASKLITFEWVEPNSRSTIGSSISSKYYISFLFASSSYFEGNPSAHDSEQYHLALTKQQSSFKTILPHSHLTFKKQKNKKDITSCS